MTVAPVYSSPASALWAGSNKSCFLDYKTYTYSKIHKRNNFFQWENSKLDYLIKMSVLIIKQKLFVQVEIKKLFKEKGNRDSNY